MNNDIIVLQPYAGLGNRLRALDSAVELSSLLSRKLQVIWDKTPDLYCSYNQLFEPSDKYEVIDNKPIKFIWSCNKRLAHQLNKMNIKYPFRYDITLYEKDIRNLNSINFDFKDLKKYHSIYFRINGRFIDPANSFTFLKPLPEINAIIKNVYHNFSEKTLGIHIRRTDNTKSICHSPDELFIHKIKEEIEKDSNVKFFLSTDSNETEKVFKNLFPERCITYEKEISRNSTQGMIDAVVDMFCLSKTNKIYGSFYSTFSHAASKIGNIPLEVLYV